MKPPQRFQNLTREKRSALLKKTVVYGSQNTVKWMSKYVAKKKPIMVKSIYALLSAKKLPKNPLPNLAKKEKREYGSVAIRRKKMTKISTYSYDSLQKISRHKN